MWLVDTETYELKEFGADAHPRYAILSHTWGEDEVTFREMRMDLKGAISKDWFSKIKNSCRIAAQDRLKYIWIDTCCIDKSSSAELSEAINNMYRYYKRSIVCYVHLADMEDVSSSATLEGLSLKGYRWFTRGWTLQELLAPSQAVFYSQDWKWIGAKLHSSSGLPSMSFLENLSGAADIPVPVLYQSSKISKYSIAQRLSWAASRQTGRPEDMAYCLMGLFDVNMPILYGEGLEKAFRRLQLEIMSRSSDQSLFAWKTNYARAGMLAGSPKDFANSGSVYCVERARRHPYSMTNVGLAINLTLRDPASAETIASLNCGDGAKRLWIYLRKVDTPDHSPAVYERVKFWKLEYSSFANKLIEDANWRIERERNIIVIEPEKCMRVIGIDQESS